MSVKWLSLNGESGYTLVELVIAMAVFSFMLLIMVVGFINVVHIHNQAVASNVVQDNARVAMDTMIQGVRNSAGVVGIPTPGPNGDLCLKTNTGQQYVYYVAPVGGTKALFRARNCVTRNSPEQITSLQVQVSNFDPMIETSGPAVEKPEVKLTLTVGSNNNTTGTTSGAALSCGPSTQDRTFCSTMTLTSGVVPR